MTAAVEDKQQVEQQGDNPNVAKISLFKGGGILFDAAAMVAKETLGDAVAPLGQTKESCPSLKITEDQVIPAMEALEKEGFDVKFRSPASLTHNTTYDTTTAYGIPAVLLSRELGVPLDKTEQGNAKVKLEKDQIPAAKGYLTHMGFTVEEKQVESTLKPKVVFREKVDPETEKETYIVLDGSAKNLARVLEREPDTTAGGRPVLEFSKKEYREILGKFGEKGNSSLDVSVKPEWQPTLKISTFEVDGKKGAVVTGQEALEVAARLNLEPGRTSNGSPKVRLTEEQVTQAEEIFKAEGYKVEHSKLKIEPTAMLRTGSKANFLFGHGLEKVAEKLGLEIESASSGNPMLKLTAKQVEPAKEVLQAEGIKIDEQALGQQKQQDGQQQEGQQKGGFSPEWKAVQVAIKHFESKQTDVLDGQALTAKRQEDGSITFTDKSNGQVVVTKQPDKDGVKGKIEGKLPEAIAMALSTAYDSMVAQQKAVKPVLKTKDDSQR